MKYLVIIVSIIFVLLLLACNSEKNNNNEKNELIIKSYTGYALGTAYHIKIIDSSDVDYKKTIDSLTNFFENSLSVYRENSTISKINCNDSAVVLDSLFINCFVTAQKISNETEGAFDITVAPLVNAFGFGFENRQDIDSVLIDSILQYVGYNKITLVDSKLI